MTNPTIPLSVIVVSRHRTRDLLRAITGIAQSDHPRLELIIVADPASADAVASLGLPLKLVRFDEPNISAARNAGLARAAAPVVAFIDDDAVPEPTWASRLSAVFADRNVVQAGGFVRGRDGLGWQSRGIEVDALGQDHPIDAGGSVALHRGTPARALKTQGTNCAFRTEALRAAGGFDPAIRFYLEDADVNLRLAERGLSALVPGAVVHHGFAASARRRADRVPTDLAEIGASLAVFLRRHATPADLATGLSRHLQAQRRRLLRHMVSGGEEPGRVVPLLAGLEAGWRSGLDRRLTDLAPFGAAPDPFLSLPGTGPRAGLLLSGPARHSARLRREARAGVAAGHVVTVVCLWLVPRRPLHSFDEAGFWWLEAGRWPAFRWTSRSASLNLWVSFISEKFGTCRPLSLAFQTPIESENGTNLPAKR